MYTVCIWFWPTLGVYMTVSMVTSLLNIPNVYLIYV